MGLRHTSGWWPHVTPTLILFQGHYFFIGIFKRMNVQMRRQTVSAPARRFTVAARPATSSRTSAVSVRSETSYVMVKRRFKPLS